MRVVNGKLIFSSNNKPENINNQTDNILKTCHNLELQIIQMKEELSNWQQKTGEISSENLPTYVKELEYKFYFLQMTISEQAQKLFWLKVLSILTLVSLWFFVITSNHANSSTKKKIYKSTESLELIFLKDSIIED
jgi:hypothetical protein